MRIKYRPAAYLVISLFLALLASCKEASAQTATATTTASAENIQQPALQRPVTNEQKLVPPPNYVVAPGGSDAQAGTLESPFATIQHALDQAKPGDVVALREGIYRQAVKLTGKSGKEGAPITLTAYGQEKPVIAGLDILKLSWAETAQPGIYVADLEAKSIPQLFYNGKPMLEARWPNCPRDTNGDWNFFSPEMWASADTNGNSYGTLACEALAKTGWDVTGAQALLNVDHQFFSWTRQVKTHSAGAGAFTYDKDLGSGVQNTDESGKQGKWNDGNKFYLFGLRQFLDAPGEWYYDTAAKKLYVFSLDEKNPNEGLLEIKARDWGFSADQDCSYLTIDGIGFFGTAFKFGKSYDMKAGKGDVKRSSHIVFKNNSVLHSSWTEFLSINKSAADTIYPTIEANNSQVVNNTFAFGALSGLYINGFDNLIENNLLHDFDYSSSLKYPPLYVNSWSKSVEAKAGRAVIRYNTLHRSGGIQARVLHADNDFSMNHVYDSYLACYGGNKDTSAVYTNNPSCAGTRFHHNWVSRGFSGTPPHPWGGGMGIRGDDLACGLTVDHNVVWDCGSVGIFIKNVNHPTPDQANRCVNNTVFNHSAYNTIKSAIVISTVAGKGKKKEDGSESKGAQAGENPNAWSTVANNLADSIYGQWNAVPLGKVKLFSNNFTSFKAATDLVNMAWNDFRPAADASAILNQGIEIEGISPHVSGKNPGIGAYQRGDATYWIPGQRVAKASFPIVPDKVKDVPADRDILMWRPAYQAVSHTVTFATSEEGLNQASASTVQKTFKGDENVFSLPKLASGQTYLWRVDATLPDKTVVKGDVWSFSTQ